jgi:type II secretory ATPase GspE/PulE/Tfp pilus assembly ATPase PilB-like protein
MVWILAYARKTLSDALRSLISHNPSIDAVRDQARKDGTISLFENALTKVKAVEISFAELMRVVR